MKFWLTLVVGTISITAGMTYLILHQGGQTLPDAYSDKGEAPPSEVTFRLGTLESNVLVVNAGETAVGKESVLVVPFQCVGENPLTVELVRIGCPCVNSMQFDGKRIDIKEVVTILPSKTGNLRISWTPKPEQAGNPAYRFAAIFLVNDPDFADHILRLELTTSVKAKDAS